MVCKMCRLQAHGVTNILSETRQFKKNGGSLGGGHFFSITTILVNPQSHMSEGPLRIVTPSFPVAISGNRGVFEYLEGRIWVNGGKLVHNYSNGEIIYLIIIT